MQNDTENMNFVGASIGMVLSVYLKRVGTVKGVLIGVERGKYLIIKLPPISDISSSLHEKNHVVIRYVFEHHVYGFRTTLIGSIQSPARLYFVDYPEMVKQLNLRKAKRYNCLLPARVCVYLNALELSGVNDHITDITGHVTDISVGGCKFETDPAKYGNIGELRIGSNINLSFRFFTEKTWSAVDAEIRIIKRDDRNLMLGLMYKPDAREASQKQAVEIITSYITALEEQLELGCSRPIGDEEGDVRHAFGIAKD